MTSVPKITIRWQPSWHQEAFEFMAGVLRLMNRRCPPGVRGLFILLAEQFAVHPIDEMKPIAGGADHGFTGGSAIIRLSFVQPMLHVQTSLRTFEDDVTHG